MSNINPFPTFTPARGRPKAATGGFPYPHRTMAAVLQSERTCRACRGTSPEWRIGRCDPCGSTGMVQA